MGKLICFVSVVNECRKVLSAAGFKQLKEKEHWDMKPSDKVRNEIWVFIKLLVKLLFGHDPESHNGFQK